MKNDKRYEFGYHKYGNFLYAFSKWLCAQIAISGINKIFFLSRDGYMMKRAFDLVNKYSIDTGYLYVSRKSLRVPLFCFVNSYEDSLKYFNWHRFVTLKLWLEYYGFSEEESVRISNEFDCPLSKSVKFSEIKSNSVFRQIYKKYKLQIIKKSRYQFECIKMYLSNSGFVGEIAIVDIGWHGSIQFYLEEILSKISSAVKIRGYYIGIDPDNRIVGQVKGFLFFEKSNPFRKRVLCSFGILERLFQKQEGSTKSYKMHDGLVLPVLDEYEYENDEVIKEKITCIQQGCIEKIKMLRTLNNVFDVFMQKKIYIEPLIVIVEKPTSDILDIFCDMYNVDGGRIYYLPQKSLYKYGFKELLRDICDSPWKTGFLKALFKIPFPYYLIYRLLKR